MAGFGKKTKDKVGSKGAVKKRTLDKREIDYGEEIGSNKIVSTDKSLKNIVVLDTYVGKRGLVCPSDIDIFIRNSLELASDSDEFVPWISVDCEKEEFIQQCINDSQADIEFGDVIEDSGIISLGGN